MEPAPRIKLGLRRHDALVRTAPLVGEQFANARSRIGTGRRDNGRRASPSLRRDRFALSGAVCLDEVEQRLRAPLKRHDSIPNCARRRAARSGSATSPCISGTMSTSGASAISALRSITGSILAATVAETSTSAERAHASSNAAVAAPSTGTHTCAPAKRYPAAETSSPM
jgi:hypothetical protein